MNSNHRETPVRKSASSAAFALALLLLPASAVLAAPAQTPQPDAQKKPQAGAASDSGGKKPVRPHSTAQENPFPADVSEHAAQQQGSSASQPPNAPDASKTPDVPAPASNPQQPAAPAAPPSQKPGEAAKENPFPEDVSRGAAASAGSSDASAPAGSSSSSSSSSGAADPNGADPNGAGPNGDVPQSGARHRLRKPSSKDIESGSLAGEGRAADDVRVGKYYYTEGNYQGAYARFAEASRLDPANLDAIYGLASTADKLHKKDEALANYKLYLDVAPDGKEARSARKALGDLQK